MASVGAEEEEECTKEEHDRLAAVIKGVHKHLRREFRASDQGHEKVWQQHSQNQLCLQEYANAMHQLATKHWAVYPETRIDWCRKVAIEYFLQGGMEKALQKDAKRKFHEAQRSMQVKELSDHTENEGLASALVRPSCIGNCDAKHSHTDVEIALPLQGKIRLLDVGSCYNPFLDFEEFDAVGIDLSPAKPTVLQCDFLHLHITTSSHHSLSMNLHQLTSPLQQLPSCSFHVVVFSLLLEYLPSPVQRWQCCVKAYFLLPIHGLLLIITPDSHSQHRNAPMMKSWKQALEELGFQRWKYEKKDHIHCMAFRKLNDACARDVHKGNNDDTDKLEHMLYIPQDFTDACYDDVKRNSSQLGQDKEQEEFVRSTTSELPLFHFDDG